MTRTKIIYSNIGDKGKLAEFKDGALIWSAPEYSASGAVNAPMVMGDIQPYQSQIDGSIISSRGQHRAHLKSHGCIEIGNETKHLKKQIKPMQAPGGVKQEILNSFDKLGVRR